MKANCQIADAAELAKIVACHLANELCHGVSYKSDSCYLTKDGTFHFVMMDVATRLFSVGMDFSPNDVAQMIDMPLWEVVGVDNGGFDDLAILFYEEI